jgi:hypothetical protein
MNYLTKVIYSVALDDKTDVLRQIWINEKSDWDTLKIPNFDNPNEDIINIIKKLHPESDFTIISKTGIDRDNYIKEIGKEYL